MLSEAVLPPSWRPIASDISCSMALTALYSAATAAPVVEKLYVLPLANLIVASLTQLVGLEFRVDNPKTVA